MKVAVTGAQGIVGSFVTQYLADRGHTVTGIDRIPDAAAPAWATRVADLTSYDETLAALAGADAVVHLAGINAPIAAPAWIVHNNNVTSSYNVLSGAQELGIRRVVQSSSVNAIGLAWSRKPEFDYFPIDLAHQTRNEDAYSLSKLIQELQADSLTRRWRDFSVVTLRLHAVLTDASESQRFINMVGIDWAVNGLFGYCTFESVADAFNKGLSADITGHEVLWVTEANTFSDEPTEALHVRHYPDVPLTSPLEGRASFFDISRTRQILGWSPATERP